MDKQIPKKDGIKEEKVLRPFSWKRKQEDYDADDKDTCSQSDHLIQERKSDIIESKSEEESNNMINDQEKAPIYCLQQERRRECAL